MMEEVKLKILKCVAIVLMIMSVLLAEPIGLILMLIINLGLQKLNLFLLKLMQVPLILYSVILIYSLITYTLNVINVVKWISESNNNNNNNNQNNNDVNDENYTEINTSELYKLLTLKIIYAVLMIYLTVEMNSHVNKLLNLSNETMYSNYNTNINNNNNNNTENDDVLPTYSPPSVVLPPYSPPEQPIEPTENSTNNNTVQLPTNSANRYTQESYTLPGDDTIIITPTYCKPYPTNISSSETLNIVNNNIPNSSNINLSSSEIQNNSNSNTASNVQLLNNQNNNILYLPSADITESSSTLNNVNTIHNNYIYIPSTDIIA
ncbi:hypothetical protein BCR32DRAFT_271559, partial [Anaeromyces robustus]